MGENKIVCPNGHTEKFQLIDQMQTLMGWVREYDGEGRLLNQDPNITTRTYRCMTCKDLFEVKYQYGKVKE